MSPHGVRTQKSNIITFTNVRTWYLTQLGIFSGPNKCVKFMGKLPKPELGNWTLSTRSRVLLEKFINFVLFMKLRSSLLCSQETNNGPYPDPYKKQYFLTLFL